MEPSHHDHKFDRQIRLWGPHGQQALESAHVLVLGSGPIASEYVKSLVLANVSDFVVMDNAFVTKGDLGNNFFIASNDIGRPRASSIVSLLNELNPQCSLKAVIRNPKDFIESCRQQPDNDDAQFLQKFQLVIATELSLELASLFCDVVYPRNIPFLHARSMGLLGILRLAVAEHTVVEVHLDNDPTDLYLHQSQLKRFPELDQFLSSFDLFNPNPDEFYLAHIPFPAILVQLYRKYRSQNPDAVVKPAAFRSFVSGYDRLKSANFEEAFRYAHYVLRDPKYFISSELEAVLSNPKADSSPTQSQFWILVRALKEFLRNEGHGLLPVSPRLPDMTADTSSYVAIKKLYLDQSLRDRHALAVYIEKVLKSLNLPINFVDDAAIDLFCRNCRSLHVSRMRNLHCDQATECDEVIKSIVCDALAEEIDGLDTVPNGESSEEVQQPPNDIHWFITLKCADIFHSRYNRYPGDCDDSMLQDDNAKMKSIACEIFYSVGLGTDHINSKCLEEVVRFGSSPIHNTAAAIAGIAAQESLKLLTNQYVPFNNLCIWNGVHATLARWTV